MGLDFPANREVLHQQGSRIPPQHNDQSTKSLNAAQGLIRKAVFREKQREKEAGKIWVLERGDKGQGREGVRV